jgi:type IV secretion system protein TrbF
MTDSARRSEGRAVVAAEKREGPERAQAVSPLFAAMKRLPELRDWQREMVPWAFGAVEYAERYWSQAREIRRWRVAFAIALGVSAVAVWGVVTLARSARAVPYVVQVDEHGYAVAIGPAEKASPVDERVVLASVAQWVRSMRTVMGDPVAQRTLIDMAFASLADGTAASDKAKAWFRAHNPLAVKDRHVDVAITKVAPMRSAKAVTVEWTETTREATGASRVARYSAFVEVAISPTQKLHDVLANPLGVFVADYSISQLQ